MQTSQLDKRETVGTVRLVNDQDPQLNPKIRSHELILYRRLRACWEWREECGYTRRLFVANLNSRDIPVTYREWCRAERDWEYGVMIMTKYPDLWEVAKSLLYRRTVRKDDPE
jgi:hypothetical protein